MEPNQTHHLTDGDHGHYSSDRHRLHRDLRHMEQGHMIHDAVDPDDLEHPPTLGHLEPKIHLHDKKEGAHYEPDRKAPESHHL